MDYSAQYQRSNRSGDAVKLSHIVDGSLLDYPYHLRAIDGGNPDRSAKRLYPHVSPLPATWEQCTQEQLGALNAVEVLPTAAPTLEPGERLHEGTPAFSGGAWRQAWVVTPAPAPSVPSEVSTYAMRRVLAAQGLLIAVLAYIDSLPLDDPMRIDWEHRGSLRRDSVGIETARVALGLTVEQADGLFVAAGAFV